MDLTDENKYKFLDPHLHNVSKKLSIDSETRSKHINACREVFDEFRKKLREQDPYFTLFNEIKYSGSYVNNIKIKNADEFDMMLCMQLPSELKVETLQSPYDAYVQLKTSGLDDLRKKQNWDKYKSMEKWLDDKNFILQNKFREWLESVINKIFNKLKTTSNYPVLTCGSNRYRLSCKKSNPAFTLNVVKLSDETVKFDLDIVPNFCFKPPHWPPMVKLDNSSKYKSREWFVIAKPINNEDNIRHKCWRVVMCEHEKEVLHGRENMKSTIRLMKQLRDAKNMHYIKSYYINTIFMWEADRQSLDFWRKRPSFLFMHMLNKFKSYIGDGKIPYFWYKKYNLLDKLTKTQLQDCSIKITLVLGSIERYHITAPQEIYYIMGIDIGDSSAPDEYNEDAPVEHNESDGIVDTVVPNTTSTAVGVSIAVVGVSVAAAGLLYLFRNRDRRGSNDEKPSV